ncbi:type III restriction protein res subunit [Hymenobacter roseosalivarius DSM 11622]|uniref:Type III restriction protein res subunit n=1 Tax=Hymenobacter roseosalivarius DSM 11622 TaxID=645990 RepID=A0A1W1UEM1_9BACT|nr:DEAD/DEAH box helicase family protein [Hymenobacter roseosalivarius]SMB79510.1 type III restriction protein res subunit [Hymenobacter roseosalivarius DSM 11622]
MELKPYQQEVITDLARFLDCVQATKHLPDAFHDFWAGHPRTPLQPFPGAAIEPYKNTVLGVPHVTVKVPTAGGKTFLAANALRTIFAAFPVGRPKAVVWLVPSITILEQTLRNLKDPGHPYRQKINTHFAGRVEVYDKAALLQGSGFSASSVQEQLSLVVLSFDSLRAKNKEDRKVYQENGNLQSFGTLLGDDEDITLMRVIQALNPVVVVDESHNAESDLSVDMLKNLNPSFILDLTATPRKNSNIISFVDALALKKEHMVKLPVIVYNHNDRTEVINSALQLQRNLELQAKQEQKAGGRYIRPIVLFQAQPKTADDNTTFEQLKKKLIDLKIPESHIRIKTAGLNELKNEDLASPKCEVRYIITVNALKEGWDAPFAYILASLADKSSAVDVEQILGRVLRQPYVAPHAAPMLNMSYVLTASSKFLETLDKIVVGLNKAGFSARDYKVAEAAILAAPDPLATFVQAPLNFDAPAHSPAADDLADIDTSRIAPLVPATDEAAAAVSVTDPLPSLPAAVGSVQAIAEAALAQQAEFEKTVAASTAGGAMPLPTVLQSLVKTYPIKEIFRTQAAALVLPQFFWKKPAASLFDSGEGSQAVLLEKEYLLEGFLLGKADTNIKFDGVSAELYRVDLDETKQEATPTFTRIDGDAKERIMAYILDPSRKDSRVKNFTRRILDLIGNLYPIADKEIERYVKRILEDFTDEQFTDFANHEYTYTGKIKDKIKLLSEEYAYKQFRNFLDQDKAFMQPAYVFPTLVSPGGTSKDITKSLYEQEGKINGFEEKVINEIANLSNIAFWTRNPERGKGFRINGFLNHYPDFIIQTKSGKTLVVETKGDHLDAEQKIKLGATWAQKAGNAYRYFMVYERRVVDGAYKLDDFLNLVRDI